mmetsp:Transcript_48552/g.90985  ORF Transcript_48552/g.90985 Transcript_48552/m.90985 type:complete len:287 (+) Transcript_48552:254-1114(+)
MIGLFLIRIQAFAIFIWHLRRIHTMSLFPQLFLGETHLVHLILKVLYLHFQRMLIIHLLLDFLFQQQDVLGKCLLVTQGHDFMHLRRISHLAVCLFHFCSCPALISIDLLHHHLLYELIFILVLLLLHKQVLELADQRSSLLPAPFHHRHKPVVHVTDFAQWFAECNLAASFSIKTLTDVVDDSGRVGNFTGPGHRPLFLDSLRIFLHDKVVVPVNAATYFRKHWFQLSLQLHWRRICRNKEAIKNCKENVCENTVDQNQVREEEDNRHDRIRPVQTPEVKRAYNE